jgi:hypothetical protein
MSSTEPRDDRTPIHPPPRVPGRKVRAREALLAVTGRLARRLSSLAAGMDASLARLARELPLAEGRIAEARMISAAARREASLLDALAEMEVEPAPAPSVVEVETLLVAAAYDVPLLEVRGARLEVGAPPPAASVLGDPETLRVMLRRILQYAADVLPPGGVVRVSVEAGPAPGPARLTFSLEGFRPRADDVDLDGGRLMTSIDADLKLAAAIAAIEAAGGEARVERAGPRLAALHALLPRAHAPVPLPSNGAQVA